MIKAEDFLAHQKMIHLEYKFYDRQVYFSLTVIIESFNSMGISQLHDSFKQWFCTKKSKFEIPFALSHIKKVYSNKNPAWYWLVSPVINLQRFLFKNFADENIFHFKISTW